MNGNLVIEINNTDIEKVENIKYLGFIIDRNLTFKKHIEFIYMRENWQENWIFEMFKE